MNPVRLLLLGFAVCGLLSSARAQDSRAQNWIHQVFDLHQRRYTQQDLFVAGYRADQARDYDTAFDKLSRFDKANHDRLHAATSPDEKAFRTWLESRLNDLEEIRKQRTRRDGAPSLPAGTNSNGLGSQSGGKGQGPSASVGGGSSATSESGMSSPNTSFEHAHPHPPSHRMNK